MLFEFATEHLVPEDEARELTRFIWHELTEVWTLSFEDLKQIPEEQRGRLGYAAFVPMVAVFGFIQSHANELFSGREAEGIVRCDDEVGVVAFYVQEKLLLRFNTLDRHGLVKHSQSGTDHKSMYFRQGRLAGINNEATRLTVGCVTNAVKTGATSVVLSCQVGDDLVYKFPIDGSDDGTLAMPVPSTPSPVGMPTFSTANHKLVRGKPR